MNDYIDLSIIERNLREGYYYGTFSFISDVRKIWTKAFKYMNDDKEATRKATELS